MEPLASPSSIKLVIKTPNQRIKDIEVCCLLDWTVEKLKSHLSTVYPTKPARSSQKIIYSGKLLDDHFVLKDVLQESEGNHQTVHLVCTPLASEASTSQMTNAHPPASSNSHVASTSSSSVTTAQSTTAADGLRQRMNAFAQHPFHNMQFAHPQHHPNVQQANMHMAGHMMPPPAGGLVYMPYLNLQHAQQLAHMHWMQHMAHVMQGNAYNMHGIPVVPPHIPYPQQNFAQQIPQVQVDQPDAAEPQAAPAQERPENRAQNRNIVMNANAGGGLMQDDDEDEENGQRDWLDYIYMAVRIFMLMSIFWFYSSAERLIIMGIVLFIIWLVQSGVFNLNRAPRNRQEEVPAVNPANNEAEGQEPGDAQGTEEDEEVEGDTESEWETQGEDPMPNGANANSNDPPHPGYLVVGYNFVVTFFTSLVPQAPGAIAQQ